jgi:hypothetical protein
MADPQALDDIDAALEMAQAEVKAVQRRARVAGIQIARTRARLEALMGTEDNGTDNRQPDPEAPRR